MISTFLPMAARLRQKLRPAVDWRACAVRSWTLAEAEQRMQAEALHDPADLDRITGFHEDSCMAVERVRYQAGLRAHGATRAYLLRDVSLLDGHLFHPTWVHGLSKAPLPWLASRPREQVDHGVLVGSRYGCRYFAHWLLDDLPTALAGAELGPTYAPDEGLTPHQRDYSALLPSAPALRRDVHFRELVMLDDVGQNRYKRERLHRLREALRAGQVETPHPGVFLMRKGTGVQRILVNEQEVADAVSRLGFRCLCPGEHTTREVIEACLGARVVIGVEGSQVAHGLLGAVQGGTLLIFHPPDRFNNVFHDYCGSIGLGYAFQVAHAHGRDFRIDVNALLRLLDRIDARQHVPA